MRDRATLYLARLDGRAGGPEAVDVHWTIPAKNLEKSLRAHLDSGSDAPFDLVRTPLPPHSAQHAFPTGVSWLGGGAAVHCLFFSCPKYALRLVQSALYGSLPYVTCLDTHLHIHWNYSVGGHWAL